MRILFALLVASSATLSAANTATIPAAATPEAAPAVVKDLPTQIPKAEKLTVDGRTWKLGHEANEDGRLIREYVLENEDVNNWTELFSIQQFSNIPISPQEFFKLFVEGLKLAVPQNKVESRVVSESNDALLGEWWVQDKSPNDQHEWIRISKKGDEMVIVRYTTKKINEVDSIGKKWEGILNTFQVDNNAKK